MTSTICTARPRYVAMDLAEHFIAAMYPEADDGERERIQSHAALARRLRACPSRKPTP